MRNTPVNAEKAKRCGWSDGPDTIIDASLQRNFTLSNALQVIVALKREMKLLRTENKFLRDQLQIKNSNENRKSTQTDLKAALAEGSGNFLVAKTQLYKMHGLSVGALVRP